MSQQKYVFGWLLILLLGACAAPKEKQQVTASATTSINTESQIVLSAAQFSGANMQLGKLTQREFQQTVRTNGTIEVPPQCEVSVSGYFGGYVEGIHLLPGQKVQQGEVLFTLENPEYLQVQQEFLEVRGHLSYLQSDYERQRELMAKNVASRKDFMKAQADYEVMQARYESMRKKLHLMHINPDTLTPQTITSIISVTAPINGYITVLKANKGRYINPTDVVLTITNTDALLLDLVVFEKDLLKVHKGQVVTFQLQHDATGTYQAAIEVVGKSIQADNRTVEIHATIQPQDYCPTFTPGMYVEGEIVTARDTVWALPHEAVVNLEEQHFVLVRKANERETLTFEKRRVIIAKGGNDYVEVVNAKDFAASDEFLIKGAFQLIMD